MFWSVWGWHFGDFFLPPNERLARFSRPYLISKRLPSMPWARGSQVTKLARGAPEGGQGPVACSTSSDTAGFDGVVAVFSNSLCPFSSRCLAGLFAFFVWRRVWCSFGNGKARSAGFSGWSNWRLGLSLSAHSCNSAFLGGRTMYLVRLRPGGGCMRVCCLDSAELLGPSLALGSYNFGRRTRPLRRKA